MGNLNHCGVVAAHTLHDTYKLLKALQHRGQDAVGISSRGRFGIDILRWQGLVGDFALENAGEIMEGDLFIGHVRYSTMKGKENEDLFAGAHPRYIGGTKDYRGSHEIIRGASFAIVQNGNLAGVSYGEDEIDTDIMLKFYIENGIEKTLHEFPAAYASAILDIRKDEAIVFRDKYGIRPLWIGEKDGKLVAASEDVAIREIGGKPIREVKPGEVVYIPKDGIDFKKEQIIEPDLKLCFFEYNYLQSQNSTLDGRTVLDVRYDIGKELVLEFKPEVDFVSYIPRAPESMARGYSDASDLPFVRVFYKQEMKRSFLDPTKKRREKSIEDNLFVSDKVDLKGKRIIFCEDSYVRGNNAPNAAKKLREKGVEYIALAIGTPPLGPIIKNEKRGCLYGIDMPPDDDFAIRRYENLEKLTKASGFDDIFFISEEGMERAHKSSLDRRCTYCIGGPNPVSN